MTNETYDHTIGAVEIGAIVSIFFFGFVSVQIFLYYKKYPQDMWKMKAFVSAVWVLECGHCAWVAYTVYRLTVSNFGRPNYIDRLSSTLSVSVGISAITCPGIQAFFAYRLRILSKNWFLPCLSWFLTLLRFISLWAITVLAYKSSSNADFMHRSRWLFITSLAISTTADTLTAGSLCYYLWQRRGPALRDQRVVDRVIVWSIQTGVLTSIGTLCMMILFITVSGLAWLGAFCVIPRLFSLSLMASLNARRSRQKSQIITKLEFANANTTRFGSNTLITFPPSVATAV